MLRRIVAATLLVLSLTVVMVTPVGAEPSYDTDFEVRDVYLISEGDVRSFHRVETFEQKLSWNQADELCQDLGFDEAIGIHRERYAGEGHPRDKYDVVTCAGDEQVEATGPARLVIGTTFEGVPVNATIVIYIATDGDTSGYGGSCTAGIGELTSTGSDGTFEREFVGDETYCIDVRVSEPNVAEDNFVILLPAIPGSFTLHEIWFSATND